MAFRLFQCFGSLGNKANLAVTETNEMITDLRNPRS